MIERAASELSCVSDTARLDAEVLLAHALGRSRAWLLAHENEAISREGAAHFAALLERRAQGWPVAYLVERREFWSREFRVTPDVLIPRPETERLVETALSLLPPDRRCRIADLGTGSGASALTLALERSKISVIATDASAAALEVARDNAASLRTNNVEFRLGDWCAALRADERFDLIASNPPYVAAGDPHLGEGDLCFEPAVALAAGETGLEAIERIVREARNHLVAGGWLVLEHGFDQAGAVAQLLRGCGYEAFEGITDFGGHQRVASARWPGAARK